MTLEMPPLPVSSSEHPRNMLVVAYLLYEHIEILLRYTGMCLHTVGATTPSALVYRDSPVKATVGDGIVDSSLNEG
jgi:hypothetical protein